MFDKKIEEYLKEKKLYQVLDCGWYYTKIIGIFDSKHEAIALWEKLANTDFANHDALLKKYNSHYEGHWYFEVEEVSLFDIIQKEIENAKDRAIEEKAKEITEKGNEKIYYNGWYDHKKEMNKVVKAILYFTKELTNLPDDDDDFFATQKCFHELRDKVR